MTSAARPINRVWYYSNLLKHSKIQSNLPFKMMHLTLILLLLDFVCCFPEPALKSKDDKLYSHIPSWQLRDTLPFPHCSLVFPHCSYKIYSHSLIAVLRHTHIPHCSLTFPHCSYKAYSHSLTAVIRHTHHPQIAHSHSLIAVIRHTHIPSLQL